MKTIDGLKAIDVLGWFPGEVVVAGLLDEVLKFVPSHTSIENFVDDMLFVVIDHY